MQIQREKREKQKKTLDLPSDRCSDGSKKVENIFEARCVATVNTKKISVSRYREKKNRRRTIEDPS